MEGAVGQWGPAVPFLIYLCRGGERERVTPLSSKETHQEEPIWGEGHGFGCEHVEL